MYLRSKLSDVTKVQHTYKVIAMNANPNVKTELTTTLIALRQYISNYDYEIEFTRHNGSELPMLEGNRLFKLSPAYVMVRQSLPHDTYYCTFLREQQQVLIDTMQMLTIDSQFSGQSIRPPDADLANDENYSLPVDDDEAGSDINYALTSGLENEFSVEELDSSSVDKLRSNIDAVLALAGRNIEGEGELLTRSEVSWKESNYAQALGRIERDTENCKSNVCDPSDDT